MINSLTHETSTEMPFLDHCDNFNTRKLFSYKQPLKETNMLSPGLFFYGVICTKSFSIFGRLSSGTFFLRSPVYCKTVFEMKQQQT